MEKTINTKFFHFSQCGSGGRYEEYDKEGIGKHVVIEALNADHANMIADDIGLYFDGCRKKMDCKCCGDRWTRVNDRDAKDVPMVYGNPLDETYNQDNCYVHYLDGTIEKYYNDERRTNLF